MLITYIALLCLVATAVAVPMYVYWITKSYKAFGVAMVVVFAACILSGAAIIETDFSGFMGSGQMVNQ